MQSSFDTVTIVNSLRGVDLMLCKLSQSIDLDSLDSTSDLVPADSTCQFRRQEWLEHVASHPWLVTT